MGYTVKNRTKSVKEEMNDMFAAHIKKIYRQIYDEYCDDIIEDEDPEVTVDELADRAGIDDADLELYLQDQQWADVKYGDVCDETIVVI